MLFNWGTPKPARLNEMTPKAVVAHCRSLSSRCVCVVITVRSHRKNFSLSLSLELQSCPRQEWCGHVVEVTHLVVPQPHLVLATAAATARLSIDVCLLRLRLKLLK